MSDEMQAREGAWK